jgi:hypothetical protein
MGISSRNLQEFSATVQCSMQPGTLVEIAELPNCGIG